MVEDSQRPRVGPYVLVRQLGRSAGLVRWLALHDRRHDSHIAYGFGGYEDRGERRRFVDAVERAAGLRHPHALAVEEMTFGAGGWAWVITPFTGDAGGLVTLEGVLVAKGGRMEPGEAEHAVRQILSVCEAGHARGLHHGPVRMEQVLVDRHGALLVELYGVERLLMGLEGGNQEVARDEVWSVAEMGYRLLTGLRAEAPMIPARRLVKGLEKRWDAWLEAGLSATGGFESAAAALAALRPTQDGAGETGEGSPVRKVLSRLRLARRG